MVNLEAEKILPQRRGDAEKNIVLFAAPAAQRT